MLLLKFIRGNLMSEESIENITKSDSNFVPTFVDLVLPDINFKGHCLIKKIFLSLKKIMNLYNSYTIVN